MHPISNFACNVWPASLIAYESSKLKDFWQLHYAINADPAHNTGKPFIANRAEQGYDIKIEALSNDRFSAITSRNGFKRRYAEYPANFTINGDRSQ